MRIKNTDGCKSIIIFGKGPSVLKCTRECVDLHEDIAICNYPVLNTFFYGLIKDRTINYHFANCGDFDKRYNDKVNEKLNVQKIFNTNKGSNNYKNFLKNKKLFQDDDLYHTLGINFFNKKHNFMPSTGIMMIKYIIDTGVYNKITLVGFDNWKIGEQEYYYDIKDINPSLKMYTGQVFNEKGLRIRPSGHSSEKSNIFLDNLKNDYPDIEFSFIK